MLVYRYYVRFWLSRDWFDSSASNKTGSSCSGSTCHPYKVVSSVRIRSILLFYYFIRGVVRVVEWSGPQNRLSYSHTGVRILHFLLYRKMMKRLSCSPDKTIFRVRVSVFLRKPHGRAWAQLTSGWYIIPSVRDINEYGSKLPGMLFRNQQLFAKIKNFCYNIFTKWNKKLMGMWCNGSIRHLGCCWEVRILHSQNNLTIKICVLKEGEPLKEIVRG